MKVCQLRVRNIKGQWNPANRINTSITTASEGMVIRLASGPRKLVDFWEIESRIKNSHTKSMGFYNFPINNHWQISASQKLADLNSPIMESCGFSLMIINDALSLDLSPIFRPKVRHSLRGNSTQHAVEMVTLWWSDSVVCLSAWQKILSNLNLLLELRVIGASFNTRVVGMRGQPTLPMLEPNIPQILKQHLHLLQQSCK